MSKPRNLASLIREYQDSDLINTIEKSYQSETSIQLDLEKIRYNNISRNHFFQDKNLKELTESISESGVLNPVLVRKKNDYYEVVSGYKRFYIAKKLHLKTIPVVIRDISDDILIYLVLSRATHKRHDNILNKTYVFTILTEEYNVSRKDIAMISKISISQVNNIMRLKNLSSDVISLIKKDRLSYGQARVLVNFPKDKQIEHAKRIIDNNMSVHDIENMAKREKNYSHFVEDIERFEEENHVKINIGRKTISLKFKKIADIKKFTKDYFNNFKK